MSSFQELPVYKTSYDLLLELFKFTKEFGKDYKYNGTFNNVGLNGNWWSASAFDITNALNLNLNYNNSNVNRNNNNKTNGFSVSVVRD